MVAVTIHHLGIAVRSLDDALGFYRQVFGVEPVHRGTVEHERVEVAVLPAGGGRIELLESTSDDSVIARFLRRRGEGLHHVALEVDDVDEAAAAVRSSGRRLVSDRVRTGAEGWRYVFVHPASAGGVLLELVERAPRDEPPGPARRRGKNETP